MNGSRSVKELADILLEAIPEDNEASYDRVSAYLYDLECNGLVGFRNLAD